jgi:hypothetical protein
VDDLPEIDWLSLLLDYKLWVLVMMLVSFTLFEWKSLKIDKSTEWVRTASLFVLWLIALFAFHDTVIERHSEFGLFISMAAVVVTLVVDVKVVMIAKERLG